MSADRPTVRPSIFLAQTSSGASPTLSISVGSRFRRGRLSEIEPISCLLSLAARICPHICCRHQMVVVSPTLDRCTCSLGSPIPIAPDIPIPHGETTPFRTSDRLDVTEFYCNGPPRIERGQRDRGLDGRGSQVIPSPVTFPVDLTTNCLSSTTLPPTPLRSLLRINLGSNPLSRSP